MSSKNIILISPIGRIPSWISTIIADKIGRLFGFDTQIKSLLGDIEFAFDQDRNQYFSTRILEELEKKAPEDCLKILAVTQEDLFIPILTHVYGEAQLGGVSSIISISRLVDDPKTDPLEEGRIRIVKEAAHELGHTFDLRHCDDSSCIMHYCRKLEDVDHKSDRFCRYCTILFGDSIKNLFDRPFKRLEG
ncbi:MAG: archaemetzincin [Bacteroidales bacterium]|nr:archaemetzincin [Bacteroidales bacterium]